MSNRTRRSRVSIWPARPTLQNAPAVALVSSTLVAAVVITACGGGGSAIQAPSVHPSPTPTTCTAGCLSAEYAIPTTGSGPSEIAAGPDGNLWFTETAGNKVAKITTAGSITEYGSHSSPFDITNGPSADSGLWYIDSYVCCGIHANEINHVTTGGAITSFLLPKSLGHSSGWWKYANGLAVGSDGNLWFTGVTHFYHVLRGDSLTYFIGTITPGGSITNEFPISSAGDRITLGPDHNLWFTEKNANQIGRITISGVVTEFPIPTAGAGPDYITAGPDGNMWFTEPAADQIGEITTAGVVTEFAILTAASAPAGIAAGPDGNVWFTEKSSNKIGRITSSGVITEFPLTRSFSGPEGIVSGPDGNLWFTEDGPQVNRIGKFIP